jgi:hypothetical protein
MGGIFTGLLLLLYWHPFPTVLLPCLCTTQQLSLATDLNRCNVSGFKLLCLPALLHRSANCGDMRCLSYETQREVSSKGWEHSYFIRAQIFVSCPQTFSPEKMWVRTLTKGYDQPTTLVIPFIMSSTISRKEQYITKMASTDQCKHHSPIWTGALGHWLDHRILFVIDRTCNSVRWYFHSGRK